MSEWTPEARQHLDDYLKRVAELCRRQGDDADEVTANLRDHVAAEVEKEGAGLMTLDLLRKILAHIGTPEEVTDAQAGGSGDEAPRPEAPAAAWQRPKLNRGCRTTAFVFLAILIPLAAILFELGSGILASISFDPMPTAVHVVLLFLIPLSFIFCECYLFSKSGAPKRRWTVAVFALNGYAVAVSTLYFIVYLPMIPLGLIAILLLGLGLGMFSPLFCMVGGFLQMRRMYRERQPSERNSRRPLVATILGIVFAVVLLGGLEAPAFVINQAIRMSCSEESDKRERGIRLIKMFGGEQDVLARCYGRRPARGRRFVPFDWDAAPEGRDEYRKLYFRVTGRPFNSVPRPGSRSGLLGARGHGTTWEEEFATDSEIGGEVVAGVVRGVSLFSSTMDVDVETGAGSAGPALACVEWTMEFRNATTRQREARAQIVLPADAVASRLSLWIEGEEREAAFGGRSQVRKAYREVAVAQRRDPALLSAVGPDRVLLQCFPIEPGKAMKVKIGVTAPLCIRDGKAVLRLPHVVERNFSIAKDFRHQVWAESGVKIDWPGGKVATDRTDEGAYVARAKLTDAELLAADSGAICVPAPAGKEVFKAKLGTATAQMSWAAPAANPEPAVCLVVDGSSAMGRANVDWRSLCAALPATAKVTAVFGGHRVATWRDRFVPASKAKLELAMWLEARDFEGGCDPVPALEEAWDLASPEPGAVVLWLHGPLPVRLSSAEGLLQRFRKGKAGAGVRVLSVSVAPGPNRLEQGLREPAGFTRVPVFGSLKGTIDYVASNLRSADLVRTYKLALGGRPVDGGAVQTAAVSDQLVRLAVYEEVRSLFRKGGKDELKRATALAVSTRLVTPVSGAVVLETKQQYQRHSLDPSAEAKPDAGGDAIPEPGGLVLVVMALLLFAFYARKRRARTASVRM